MEIDEQNAQNHAVIERVTAEVDQLQEQMEQSDSEEECHSLQMKLKLSLQEISTIERNTQQNELVGCCVAIVGVLHGDSHRTLVLSSRHRSNSGC